MSHRNVLIVGGGLSGLYLAYRLQQSPQDYEVTIVEARDRLGGRLESAQVTLDDGSQSAFDLGGTWFWPSTQPKLASVITQLGVKSFAQYQQGDVLIERSSTQQPQRLDPHGLGMADARRVRGGMYTLIETLADTVGRRNIRLGRQVSSIVLSSEEPRQGGGSRVQVVCQNGDEFNADTVVLALPPRLAASGLISFSPPLPETLIDRWMATPTWMAPHAKYAAVYETPFWRDQDLAGNAYSTVGPLGEIHDASSFDAAAGALFGFFSIPAQARRAQPQDQLRSACRAQLTRLFGEQAGHPRWEAVRDWATQKLTATEADVRDRMPVHNGSSEPLQAAPDASSVWHRALVGAGSEWSPAFPGYIAGAIDAADRAFAVLTGIIASD